MPGRARGGQKVLLPAPAGRCRLLGSPVRMATFALWPLVHASGRRLALKVSTPAARAGLAISAHLQRQAKGPCVMGLWFAWRHGPHTCWLEPWASRSLSAAMDAERAAGQPAPPSVQLARVARLMAAAAGAHAAGVGHRDIKPDNALFFGSSDRTSSLVLSDFGLSVPLSQTADDGAGTLAYQAPEVAKGEPFAPSADVFSLGATWVEMVVGMAPFEGENERDTLARLLANRPLVGPPELAAVLSRTAGANSALCEDTARWAFGLCAYAAAARPALPAALAAAHALARRWRLREQTVR